MSALRVSSRRITPVAREGRIIHNGHEYACRLHRSKLEYNAGLAVIDPDKLVAGAFAAGFAACEQQKRAALPVGTILPLNPVSLKAMCIGVDERLLADDVT